MAAQIFTEADAQSLCEKLNALYLTDGEAQALAAAVGGELVLAAEVEPYTAGRASPARVSVKVRTLHARGSEVRRYDIVGAFPK